MPGDLWSTCNARSQAESKESHYYMRTLINTAVDKFSSVVPTVSLTFVLSFLHDCRGALFSCKRGDQFHFLRYCIDFIRGIKSEVTHIFVFNLRRSHVWYTRHSTQNRIVRTLQYHESDPRDKHPGARLLLRGQRSGSVATIRRRQEGIPRLEVCRRDASPSKARIRHRRHSRRPTLRPGRRRRR